MKNTILLTFFLFFLNISFSQGKFLIGDKVYDCTEKIIYGKIPYLITFLIAKDGDKGKIIFYGSSKPSGTIVFYLDDNTTISLKDYNSYDYYNFEYVTEYRLTSSEIERLKKSNLTMIRIPKFKFNDGSVSEESKVYYGTYEENGQFKKSLYVKDTKSYFIELFK